MTGHSVIAVPVPELDAFVRARTARYDASFVSTDPRFVHAHITLLGPWLPDPTADDLAVVAEVLADQPPIAFTLEEVREFLDGIVNVLPSPAEPFDRITARLLELFPQSPPYAGRYQPITPHVTLDHTLTGASVASLVEELDDLLPLHTKAERVDLQWWANHDCHVRHSWRLGG